MTNLKLTKSKTNASVQNVTWSTLTTGSIDDALYQWRALENRLGSRSLASSSIWVECWLRHYGGLVPHKFLLLHSEGELTGIALLTEGVGKKLGPFDIKTAHLGTAGEPQIGSVCVEYNRVLVDPDFTDLFISGIWESLQNDGNWEQFCLDGFSESDLEPWVSHVPEANLRYRDSKYFDLTIPRAENQELITYLGKSTRANIRRQLRKYGELECEWAETLTQATDIFSELVTLHQARWNAIGEPGAFANERFLQFQEEAMVRLFSERKVVLFRVRHDGETVGCLLLLIDQNRLLDYLSGFADFNEKPSPGMTSHYLCMLDGLKRGYDAYDFLVGDKRHKENLSTHTNQLCWLTFNRPTWKLRAYHGLRKVKGCVQSVMGKKQEKETAGV